MKFTIIPFNILPKLATIFQYRNITKRTAELCHFDEKAPFAQKNGASSK